MPVRAPRPLTRSGQCLCPRTCPFCSADDSREGLPAIRLHPDGSRRRVSLAIDELALVLLEEDPNVVPWKWRSPPQVGTGWLLSSASVPTTGRRYPIPPRPRWQVITALAERMWLVDDGTGIGIELRCR